MITWDISLSTILAILAAGAGFYFKTTYDSKVFKEDIVEIKLDLKVLNDIITDLALSNQRQDQMEERVNLIDKRLDDLRHRKGFVDNENSSK
jgi:hypothetical protein